MEPENSLPFSQIPPHVPIPNYSNSVHAISYFSKLCFNNIPHLRLGL
jgi:hypothetical protein